MQARRRTRPYALPVVARSCTGRRLELEEPDASAQQRLAAFGVAGMDGGYIGRGQRVGEDAHLSRRGRPAPPAPRCHPRPARSRARPGRATSCGRADGLRTRSGKSSSSVRSSVSSVFAGSSCTSCAGAHSKPSSLREQVAHHRRGADRLDVLDGFRSARTAANCALVSSADGLRPAPTRARRRVGGGAVPVQVELLDTSAHDRADGDHVQVGEDHPAARRRSTRRRCCGRRRPSPGCRR